MLIIFIVAIALCVGLVVASLTGLIVPFMILVLALAIVLVVVAEFIKIREKITKRKGKLDMADLISVKHIFDSDPRSYYMLHYRYVDEAGVTRERHDIVHYTEEEMEMLGLDDDKIEIIVYKNFAVALNPYEVAYIEERRIALQEEAKLKQEEIEKEIEDEYHKNADGKHLKECPYCGYKTFEDDFKCPMCGGDLDFKKKKKSKKNKVDE